MKLFMCGDVIAKRDIDEVLPHPCKPHLFESWVRSAVEYVELAERSSGTFGRRLDFGYPWGEALAVLGQVRPDARIVNLETAVTTSEDANRTRAFTTA
jgi:poly-gamma-glutamate synthesis protein (capsule biosynthesis protein)